MNREQQLEKTINKMKESQINNLKEYNNMFTVKDRKEILGDTLRLFRQTYGFSQKEVAELVEVNTQTYGAYESGRNEPPIEVLVRLSKLFNVSIDRLVRVEMGKEYFEEKKKIEECERKIEELKKKIDFSDPKIQKIIEERYLNK